MNCLHIPSSGTVVSIAGPQNILLWFKSLKIMHEGMHYCWGKYLLPPPIICPYPGGSHFFDPLVLVLAMRLESLKYEQVT